MKLFSVLIAVFVFSAVLPPPAASQDDGRLKVLRTFNIGEMPVKTDVDGSGCATPRPANIGCNVTCKPCIYWLCVSGSWVRHEVDWNDTGLCGPPRAGFPPPQACPRTPTGFCPAECAVCF